MKDGYSFDNVHKVIHGIQQPINFEEMMFMDKKIISTLHGASNSAISHSTNSNSAQVTESIGWLWIKIKFWGGMQINIELSQAHRDHKNPRVQNNTVDKEIRKILGLDFKITQKIFCTEKTHGVTRELRMSNCLINLEVLWFLSETLT